MVSSERDPRHFSPTSGAALPDGGRRMVLIRLSSLGDIILTTGALLWWHEQSGATFTVITKAAFAPIFIGHPAVEKIVELGKTEQKLLNYAAFCRKLAKQHLKTPLVDLHGNIRSRILSLFWKGEVFRYPKMALARRLFLATHGRVCKNTLRSSHVTLRYAAALPAGGLPSGYDVSGRKENGPRAAAPLRSDVKPRVFLSHEELARAESLLPKRVKKRIVLHPYARHMAKSWSMETWIALASALIREYDIVWVGIGDLRADAPGLSLVNKTNLRELAAVIASCDCIITGDSGPMHLAAAVDTAIAALFGPTCLEWGFYPDGKNVRLLQHEMPCRPCSLHGDAKCGRGFACLNDITQEEVLDAVHALVPPDKEL